MQLLSADAIDEQQRCKQGTWSESAEAWVASCSAAIGGLDGVAPCDCTND
jgi:hypothetical protein